MFVNMCAGVCVCVGGRYQMYIMWAYERAYTESLILCVWLEVINPRCACAAKGYCSRSVGRSVCWSVCPHVFSRTVATVDTKRGYVVCTTGARYNKSLERHRPRTACLRRGPKIIYSYNTRCVLIRDRRPTAWTAWDGFAHPAATEATCIMVSGK